MRYLLGLATFAAVILSSTCMAENILIVGHRGASGYRPEHTQASYELAIAQGADFIEPDLVITKDGFLIARHENEISQTTDVADKFPARKVTKTIDGQAVTGWFAEDFTLAEIKTLRARERLPFRDHSFDGQFEILTFKEVLGLARQHGVGVYPETKHPSYFQALGFDFATLLIQDLEDFDWNRSGSPVYIQSFELSILRQLRPRTPLPLIFLVDEEGARPYDHVLARDPRTYGDLMKPTELREIAKIAYGIGPWKRLIVPESSDGRLLPPTSLVNDAHAAGLKVHAYTFRSDGDYLNSAYHGNPDHEYRAFRDLGIDGLFTDFPDHAVRALGH